MARPEEKPPCTHTSNSRSPAPPHLPLPPGRALPRPRRSSARIKRSDLTGTNMEVIMTVLEAPLGAVLPKHFHHGEEAFYVLEGAMTEVPGQPAGPRIQGTGGINVREVPHAGYKVVGDKPLKLLTVHVVDKGKP